MGRRFIDQLKDGDVLDDVYLAAEKQLRYRQWVEERRAYVARATSRPAFVKAHAGSLLAERVRGACAP